MPFGDISLLESSLRYWVWWIKPERKISMSSEEICCCFSSWRRRSLYHNGFSLWIAREKSISFVLSVCPSSSAAWHCRRIGSSLWGGRALLKLNPWGRKQPKARFNSWILSSTSVEDPESGLRISNDNFTKETEWFEVLWEGRQLSWWLFVVIFKSFWLGTSCWVVIVARSNHRGVLGTP